MDYYLYTHSNDDGIFYVGKGKKGRASSWDHRSDEWKEVANKGYTTKFESNGTHKDILALEKIMIKSLSDQGVNLINKIHNPNWSRSAKDIANISGNKHHSFWKKDKTSPEYKSRRKAERIAFWAKKAA